jgi:hypothetical protein
MTVRAPQPRLATLAQRALELKGLALPGARLTFQGGKTLRYHFQIAPGTFGRLYQCVLVVTPDARRPDLIVLDPDLSVLAGGRKLPHTYPHKGKGTKLCLWWPKGRDWTTQMEFTDTYVPWAAEWFFYFEDWLFTGEWAGGGVHPDMQPKRWSRQRAAEDARSPRASTRPAQAGS